MGIKESIKKLLQEADLYKKHGLLDEARGKYTEAEQQVREHDKIQNQEKILKGIANKIRRLDSDTERVEKGPSSPKLSAKAQDLIKNLFSFSKTDSEEEALLEGAIALAKFGQFERALGEFNKLDRTKNHTGWWRLRMYCVATSNSTLKMLPQINMKNGPATGTSRRASWRKFVFFLWRY